MQLISCSPLLRIDIRDEKKNWSPNGEHMSTDKPLFIKFYPGGNVPAHIKEKAELIPGFRAGIGRDEDPYITRIGWWDSYAAQKDLDWSDADREYVEARILQVGDPNILLVEDARVDAPYAKYDQHRKTQGQRKLEHVIADISTVYEAAGFDVGQAVAYERQNLNDEKVIAALHALAAETPSEVEEVVAA